MAPSETVRAIRAELSITDAAVLVSLVVLTVGWLSFLLFPAYTAGVAVVALLGVPGLAALVTSARRHDTASVAGLVLAGWVVVAALLSGAPALALRGTVGRESNGLIVIGLIGLWASARCVSEAVRTRIPAIVLALLGVAGGVGLLQAIVARDSGLLSLQFGRATGFAPNAVYFGGLMAGATTLSAVIGGLPLRVRLVLVGYFAMCTELSGSRIATIAIAVALVAVAVGRRRTDLAGALWSLGVFVSSTMLTATIAARSGDLAGSIERGGADGGGRLDAWRYGASAVLDRPVAGWGFGRFRAATQSRFTDDFVRVAGKDDLRQAWFDAHNLAVDLAVSIGLVGLVLAAWFMWEVWRRTAWPGRIFGATLALTWLAQPPGLATLPLTVLVVGCAWTRIDAIAGADRPTGAVARTATTVAATLGVALASYFVVADARLNRAVDDGAASRIERAAAWYPGDSVVADLVAQAWFFDAMGNEAAREPALRWSQRAADREPDRPLMWSRLALRQASFGDEPGAMRSIERALDLQPWHYASWRLMFQIGVNTDQPDLVDRALPRLCALGEEIEACP